MIAAFFVAKNCVAQKKNNKHFILSYGANIIFEDRDQFVSYLNNQSVLWNISPITFGIEKRLNNLFGLSANLGSNLYPEKQKINGLTLKVPKDVLYLDLYCKLNLLAILKYKSSFDPYLTIGTGYLNRGLVNEINLNLGSGFNYWINDIYGINLNAVYKINQPFVFENTPKDLLQVSIMLVQTIK